MQALCFLTFVVYSNHLSVGIAYCVVTCDIDLFGLAQAKKTKRIRLLKKIHVLRDFLLGFFGNVDLQGLPFSSIH